MLMIVRQHRAHCDSSFQKGCVAGKGCAGIRSHILLLGFFLGLGLFPVTVSYAHPIPVVDQSDLALEGWLKRLRHKKVSERVQAALHLGSFLRRRTVIQQALHVALKDPSIQVRHEVSHALAHLGKYAIPSVPTLLQMMFHDPSLRVRQRIAFSLSQMGDRSAPVLRALEKAFLVGNAAMKMSVLFSLGRLQADSPQALRILEQSIHKSRPKALRQRAVGALGSIGRRSVKAITLLQRVLRMADADLRYHAADALRYLGPKAERALPVLLSRIRTDSEIRVMAIRAVGAVGVRALSAVPLLRQMLHHKAWQVREATARALGKIGPAAFRAVSALTWAVLDSHPLVREAARQSLLQAMVVIPKGFFWMGCTKQTDRYCHRTEHPRRRLFLKSYRVDKTEVTQKAYAACVKAERCSRPVRGFKPRVKAEYPVTHVTWQQAHKFCAWLGKRLPTEAEWEKAARGVDGRRYPWGDAKPTCQVANSSPSCGNKTFPVGSYPKGASPFGVLDMTGNVEEWVQDWFRPYPTTSRLVTSTMKGNERVARGCAFNYDFWHCRATHRFYANPTNHSQVLGFRCAASLTTTRTTPATRRLRR